MQSLWTCFPFFGTLLSISVLPLVFARFWEKHQNLIFILLSAITVIWIFGSGPFDAGLKTIAHHLYHEYTPFILSITALYLVTTSLQIKIKAVPSTKILTLYLACGAFFASFIGTTGASILLINPLIDLIQQRQSKTHIIIFFIFLVSNCGGVLTPLGDPPLSMGYLNGVPFLWPIQHLWKAYLVTNGLLLCIFMLWDFYLIRQEPKYPHLAHRHFSISQKKQLPWLALTIVMVFLLSELNDVNNKFPLVPGWVIYFCNFLGLLGIIFFNLKTRKFPVHWYPIIEVAKIFLVIFITLIPVISLLSSQHPLVLILKDFVAPHGIPHVGRYFWLTGIFSAFLDNAPTYLLFAHMAAASMQDLLHKLPHILKAISLGSVFMGALTYIGNAPNLMVRAIALDQKIPMPSFLGYMGYSLCILPPVFFITRFFCFCC
jgi:Na+/H+ antiporter NhaD/arsenite permease-like protein